MSYSLIEARTELENGINEALTKRDGDTLKKLAEQLSDDEAEALLEVVSQWNKEDDADWDYDRYVDNNL